MFTYEEIMSLNELEMNVCQYILKNKEKAGYMKIRELADEAPVVTILEILGNKLYRLSLGG